MENASEVQWKKFVEGVRRGCVGPFVQSNIVEGTDCCRVYTLDSKPVACMRVCDSNSEKLSYECKRTFEILQELIDATANIYIPTQEEYDAWDDRSIEDPGFDFMVELCKIDPGWAS